jgi:hypothetical protein
LGDVASNNCQALDGGGTALSLILSLAGRIRALQAAVAVLASGGSAKVGPSGCCSPRHQHAP